jgi:adenylate cyclase
MNSRLRIPIVLKIGGITTVLMLIVGLSITLTSANYLQNDALDRERHLNMEQVTSATQQVEGLLANSLDKIRTVANLALKDIASAQAGSTSGELADALKSSFQEDPDLVNLEIYRLHEGKTELVKRVTQTRFLQEQGIDEAYFDQLRVLRPFPMSSIFSRNIEVLNSSVKSASKPNGIPLLTIGQGLVEDENGQTSVIAIADVRLDRLQKLFRDERNRHTFFLVDKEGRLMAHPKDEWVFDSRDMKANGIVNLALSTKTKFQLKTNFIEPESHENFLGAYGRTAFGPSVVVQVPQSVILEPVRNVRRMAIMINGCVISAAFFFVFLFSMRLTSPIERLVGVTREVANGNFEVKSDVDTHDEVGELAKSFDTMVTGLKERDKIRNVLNKFHGSGIAEDMIQGDLQLGGSNKEVTVFFSDIRGFTKFSEGHTPEEVVGMLNEYFGIMVAIITANHGIVDKFVGDAIMAVWGAPNSSGDDQNFALKACLEMRVALGELNKRRLAIGQSAIMIGMGLHTGRAISGTIGSNERMEYTVIGDTVNLTARIEASTKSFGTDLLVSDAIVGAVPNGFVYSLAGEAEVKGKSEPIKMYLVRGYRNAASGEETIIETPYSSYSAESDEKVKVVEAS